MLGEGREASRENQEREEMVEGREGWGSGFCGPAVKRRGVIWLTFSPCYAESPAERQQSQGGHEQRENQAEFHSSTKDEA